MHNYSKSALLFSRTFLFKFKTTLKAKESSHLAKTEHTIVLHTLWHDSWYYNVCLCSVSAVTFVRGALCWIFQGACDNVCPESESEALCIRYNTFRNKTQEITYSNLY